jgi:hypothetical protein
MRLALGALLDARKPEKSGSKRGRIGSGRFVFVFVFGFFTQ